MYYALADKQLNGQLLATGRNDTSLSELKIDFLSYLSGDHDEEELKELDKLPIEELTDLFDFEILKQYETQEI